MLPQITTSWHIRRPRLKGTLVPPSSGSGQAGSSRVGPGPMFTNRDVGRLEKELRSTETHVRTRALGKISRLSPDARAALFSVHNTSWSPLLLGSLIAVETGTALEAASLERGAVETLARALGGRSVA